MALGIRGANPIWSEVNLQGKLFDDTYFLYVLENTLPYQPAIIYHDPDLTTPWTNPIQFLGNGTLPNDVFYEQGKFYRLEFRQTNGFQPPSQNDPLIYEVNDYSPGTGGDTPINSVAFASSNQITNPQFALINFTSPFTLNNVTNPEPIDIGPGWVLNLLGTGSVTIQQIALNNDNKNPSNAPYALRLQLSGWNIDGVSLTQRFQQNGMLWANKIVSTTLTSRIEGAPQFARAILVDSNNSTLSQILTVKSINELWNEFKGYGTLTDTSNPNLPPLAYIDYKLFLPSNVDIYVTSIQLVVQDSPFTPDFEQDSIERQIDHVYHYDYPLMPIGSVIDYYGFGVDIPNYLPAFGQEVSRITYNKLFNVLTILETVTLTSGLTTFNVANGLIYSSLKPLEGSGIQAGTVISSITGNVVTMSLPSVASGPQSIRFFCTFSGDGSTTFNIPLLAGITLAGAYGGLFPNGGVGTFGGGSSVTLIPANLPPHQHGYQPIRSTGIGGLGFVNGVQAAITNLLTDGGSGLQSLPFGIIQPTRLALKLIKYK